MFKFEEINKVFETDFWNKPFTALTNVSFEVDEGSVLGFLGANGSGKTTSIKILLDFIRPTSGNVTFSTKLGKNRREIVKKIGYLPERPYFYPDLTGLEFLQYIGKLNNIKSVQINIEIKKWTELLKIDFALDRKLKFYSKGMLQRLGFTACLVNNPELLILDEPLAGLDPIGRKEFKEIMTSLAAEGKTIFFSSHILHDVEEVSNEIIILDGGQVVYSGNMNKLIQDNSKEDYELLIKFDQKINNELFNKYNIKETSKNLYSVGQDSVADTLRYLADNKIEVVKFSKKIPTLEEIVYKADK